MAQQNNPYGLSMPDFAKRVGLPGETKTGEAMRLYMATYGLALALDIPLESAYKDVLRLNAEAPETTTLTVVDALGELYRRLNDCRLDAQRLAAKINTRSKVDEEKRP